MKRNTFDISGITLGHDGRVELSDAELLALERDATITVAGGRVNTECGGFNNACANNSCGGLNDTCNNYSCGPDSSNSNCRVAPKPLES